MAMLSRFKDALTLTTQTYILKQMFVFGQGYFVTWGVLTGFQKGKPLVLSTAFRAFPLYNWLNYL